MMTQLKMKHACILFGGLHLTMIPFSAAYAKPWLDAGDMQLRHQLQILVDADLLDAPLTTWPLSSRDIYERLKQVDEGVVLSPAVRDSLASIKRRLAKEDYNSNFKVSGELRTKKLLIRDFSGDGREGSLLSYDGEWGSPIVDIRLKGTLTDAKSHYRLDESYLAGSIGNWKVTFGNQSRWWGPGWDGSLILSNNARPIPALSIENISSEAFENKYLSWLGPNKLHFFVGKLESNRAQPDAKLIGTRFTFRPVDSLEIGLHRVTQWGGGDQSESVSSLFKTLLGLREDNGDQLGTVYGNHIAGGDFRWKLPIGLDNQSYALYGQYIGEDRVDGSLALGDSTFLLGASVSGYSNRYNGSWRAYIEAVDTSAAFYKGRKRNNIIYNHGRYRDGYRYLDVSMGHAIDSDSKMVSLGGMLTQKNGNFWRAWIKKAKLNEDGEGLNPIAPKGRAWSALGVSLDKKINPVTTIKLGAQIISDKPVGGKRDNDFAISIGFSRSF